MSFSKKTLQEGTTRKYAFIPSNKNKTSLEEYHKGKRPALEYWVEIGAAHNVDLLIVPQILTFRERQGSEYGVKESASVMLDFFLIDVREGILVYRYFFDEEQVGLAENLLEIGTFFSRGGVWLTTDQLAQEGMTNVIKEFGL